MAALDQISQDAYIDWYLSPQRTDTHYWVRALIYDPDLDAAEDLLEAAVPTPQYIWSSGPAQPQPARASKSRERPGHNPWKSVSNIAFIAALAAIVIGAAVFGGRSGASALFLGFSYLLALISIALRVFLGERKTKHSTGKARHHEPNEFRAGLRRLH